MTIGPTPAAAAGRPADRRPQSAGRSAGPPPTRSVGHPAAHRTVRQLRDTHRALRAERLRVCRWRRLLRARMDLAAAALAMPEPLGHVVGHVPAAAQVDLPMVLGLVAAVSTGGPEGELDRLEQLRGLDRRLAAYESTVVDLLREVAAELLDRLVADAVTADVVPRPTRDRTMGHTVPWT